LIRCSTSGGRAENGEGGGGSGGKWSKLSEAEERAELEKAGTVVVLMRGCAALDLVSPRAARTISRSLSCVFG
jgi:hypothetical protein